jgi:hypothetical protein
VLMSPLGRRTGAIVLTTENGSKVVNAALRPFIFPFADFVMGTSGRGEEGFVF